MSEQTPPTIRKRLLGTQPGTAPDQGAINLAQRATLHYSAEDPTHPIEHLLDNSTGPGGTRWISPRWDVAEEIVVEFDEPTSISRLVYEVEETERERTQEVRVEVSTDGGRGYRQVLAQEYTFSPRGATFQREDLRLELQGITHARFRVIPNKGGSGPATLTSLRLFR